MSKAYLYLVSVSVAPDSFDRPHPDGAIQAFYVETSAAIEHRDNLATLLRGIAVDNPGWGAPPSKTLIAFSLIQPPKFAGHGDFRVISATRVPAES